MQIWLCRPGHYAIVMQINFANTITQFHNFIFANTEFDHINLRRNFWSLHSNHDEWATPFSEPADADSDAVAGTVSCNSGFKLKPWRLRSLSRAVTASSWQLWQCSKSGSRRSLLSIWNLGTHEIIVRHMIS